MDIAVPVRADRDKPDPLAWVLRTINRHLPHGRIFLAGPRIPTWVDTEAVTWIRTAGMGTKHQNIGENLRAVLASDISDDFVWFNDDMFILKDITRVELHHDTEPFDAWYAANRHKSPALIHESAAITAGLLGQYELLNEWGEDTTINCDLHVPIPLNKTRLWSVLDRIPSRLAGHFRALYGAGLPSTPLADPKIKSSRNLPDPSWPYVSTAPSSWNPRAQLGEWLRSRYWTPSPYELTP